MEAWGRRCSNDGTTQRRGSAMVEEVVEEAPIQESPLELPVFERLKFAPSLRWR
jgi:hypothetical protein